MGVGVGVTVGVGVAAGVGVGVGVVTRVGVGVVTRVGVGVVTRVGAGVGVGFSNLINLFSSYCKRFRLRTFFLIALGRVSFLRCEGTRLLWGL